MAASDSDRKERHRHRHRHRREKHRDGDDRKKKNRSRSDKHDDDDEEDSRLKKKEHRHRDDDDSNNNDNKDDGGDRKVEKRRADDKERRKRRERDDDDDASDNKEDRKRKRRKKSSRKGKSRKRSKSKKKRKRRAASTSSSSSSSDDSDSDSSSDDSDTSGSEEETSKVVNQKLLAKLTARGETLDERKERRVQKRAAKIETSFGYTAEENPFNDPNLHEAFTWTKKKEKTPASSKPHPDTLGEIETIRQRRKDREIERDEMDRLRAEESRMKELENYDEWAKKEEEFHLEQQRKRSAIRLIEGREKPVDILAKNMLLFGLTEEEKNNRAAVKYKERYNALEQLEELEAELEEPHKIVEVLKLAELQELIVDVDAFRMLEKEGMSGESKGTILKYWNDLYLISKDEIKYLQNGSDDSPYARKVKGIKEIFEGQSGTALMKMKDEIDVKLGKGSNGAAFDASSGGVIDRPYWLAVKEQLTVHLAKLDLSELHSKMLVRQLEKLEQRKEELAEKQKDSSQNQETDEKADEETNPTMVPTNVAPDFGNLEEELGLTDEIALTGGKLYAWQDRYTPRKPRYFNRVKTGYDWNKYNQTHFDSDNPPPKTVQGYKFNIFYPDLVDPTKTPRFFLEPADSDDFCILRFHAGAPYEDIAFKIINREWNRSRKRGFRCTFERGVLSLYVNFKTHWYRR